MKKTLKRLMAITLSIAMICSVVSVSVSAEGCYTITLAGGYRGSGTNRVDGVLNEKFSSIEGDTYTDENGVVYLIDKENNTLTFTTDDTGSFVFPEYFFDMPGYNQYAWVTRVNSNSGTRKYAGDTFTVKKNTTYYGGYEQLTYSINFLPGSDGIGEIVSLTKKHKAIINIEDAIFTRPDHVQIGWSTTENAGQVEYEFGASYTITANVDFYPVWEPIAYDFIKNTESINFGSICEGYSDEIQAVDIEIINNSNISAEITVPESEWYNITCSATTVAIGETFNIQLIPKASLTAGEYAEQLTFGVNEFDTTIVVSASFKVVASGGHNFEQVVKTAPTCTEDGEMCNRCTICGYENDFETIDAGHSFTDNICDTCGVNNFIYEIIDGGVVIQGVREQYPEVVIPEYIEGFPVRKIAENAFSSNRVLKSITIPSTITVIEDSFISCIELENVYISDIVAWCTIDFVSPVSNPIAEFSLILGDVGLPRTLYLNGVPVTEVVIPEGVTEIKPCAFFFYTKLTSIELPESLKIIGEGAFVYCCNLEEITIPENVESIGMSAFSYCLGLKSVAIPGSVTNIDEAAFAYCEKLAEITVAEENEYYTSEDGVVFNKNKTTLVQYPCAKAGEEYVIPDSVTNIGGYAFVGCMNLTLVSIPDSVESIGTYAFSYCDNVTSFVIPDSVTIIGSYAFANCDELSSVSLPAGLTIIEYNLFDSCTKLESITIPDSVVTIETQAFDGCSSLKYVFYSGSESQWNSIVIDYNSDITGDNSCLENAIIHYNSTDHTYSTEWSIDVAPTCITTGTKSHHCTVCDFKADITEIETTDVHAVAEYNKDFDTNTKTGVCDICGNTVTLDMVSEDFLTFELNDDLASYCLTDCYDSTTFTDIEIPATYKGLPVTYIGAAFRDNGNLTSVAIPDSVIGIRDNAFFGCYGLRDVVNSNKLTYIGNSAFAYCSNLTTITIPDSVTYIGDYAFEGCSSLISITIPEGVTNINNYTFDGCESLTSVVIPDNVTSIGAYAFYDCLGVTSLIIGNGVTSIGEFAFNGCKGLTSVTVPDSVASIGEYAFYHCHNLKSIVIGNGVSSIGDEAFGYCYSLTTINVVEDNLHYTSENGVLFDKNITRLVRYPIGKTDVSYSIPDGVISVDANAFRKCDKLTSVIIPDSVTKIGDKAFIECEINTVVFGEGIEQIGEDAFGECRSLEYVVFSELGIDDITKYFSFSITPTITSNSSSEFIGTGNEVTITCSNYDLDFTCVVKNDVNGDSVCDALDAWQVGLSSNGHTTLDGAYAMAADSNSDDIVDIADYQAIVNKAVS